MAYGTKDEMTTHGNGIKVKYHCHVPKNEIPSEIDSLEELGLTIDKITKHTGGYWRIDYFEIK